MLYFHLERGTSFGGKFFIWRGIIEHISSFSRRKLGRLEMAEDMKETRYRHCQCVGKSGDRSFD